MLWLKVKFSLWPECSGRLVLTNGKRPLERNLNLTLARNFLVNDEQLCIKQISLPRYRIKRFKQEKWTFKTCQTNNSNYLNLLQGFPSLPSLPVFAGFFIPSFNVLSGYYDVSLNLVAVPCVLNFDKVHGPKTTCRARLVLFVLTVNPLLSPPP